MTSDAQQIPDLVRRAVEMERSDREGAAEVWGQVAASFPEQSQQHQFAVARAAALARGERVTPLDPPAFDARSIAITIMSMLISIAVYALVMGSWQIALGFVLLILVHEMGHVIANVRYHIRASLPLFIPFVGALIKLKQQPPNAKVEAIIGIAGPIAGTIGAVACFAWFGFTQSEAALKLAWFGFVINLFNMFPLPPLDGGRVMAAVSPWVWLVGLLAISALVVENFRRGQGISILPILLIMALPRVLQFLKHHKRLGPYYDISRGDRWMIGTIYAALTIVLVAFTWYTQTKLGVHGIF